MGDLIENILDVNTQMWHAQEITYDALKMSLFSHEQFVEHLKKGTGLNLKRNFAIDAFDAALARLVGYDPELETAPMEWIVD